ncbi:riboflavin synthase [Maridesulfovibrio hydrothermalis]|uniref:Riboflavin synthase n=1 Tax=Maridesulfovibrio hydrothermalis AM13 = DSM 14728 TaxID=1121451 RepID=L0R723_9BACT|nr:riboflavin synthase [Maridesulfovibrio hydrothermalis]CCO22539.1 Riboflavin synthase alpha chain [Maridesulfovibrio hydrothermalis AM13 = DSM 14728]
MFTGLVQGKGRIDKCENRGKETRFTVTAPDIKDYVKGESIAINGVCLTVETYSDSWFTCYASKESMSITNLGNLKPGSKINYERALAMGDRLGGHIVSGHVDCLGSVDSVRPAGESKIYRIKFPEEHGKFIIPKGSVALDGISLTVNDCGPDYLEVNIIPETQGQTTISDWTPGYRVNIETDVIGKYVQRMIGPWTGQKTQDKPQSKVTMDFLREHGF